MDMDLFTGIWLPLITPFRDGRVDTPALENLTDLAARAGCRGVVLCGTTGEPATLTPQEKRGLLAAVRASAQGRLGLLMGLSGSDTAAVADEARAWSDSGIDGLLISAPYYVRPSQEGILLHFERVARHTPLPIVLYNIPYRTGVNIEVDTALRLARSPQFTAIKEAGGGNIDQLFDLIHKTPLKVLAGEDQMVFINACLGGHGAIAAAAHVRPDLYVRSFALAADGRLAEARALFAPLVPLIRALFAEPNPGPLKAALALQGLIKEELRLPMTPVSAACREQLRGLLQGVGAL
jgi:4-hydroxy-tetrahydrodipicolinate synthase